MFRIVEESKVLDVNSSYSYLMWGKYFSKSSIVAEIDHELIGFVTGFLQPNSPDTLFVWQVAVDPKHRGKKLATRLIETLLDEQKQKDVCYLEATRSEEHTSELQSRGHLVCRLLLEKKKDE